MHCKFPEIRVPEQPDTPPLAGEYCLVACIMAIAFVLRFAWLDTPTLILDEALVLTAAEQSPLYIFLRSLATDAHPPYFYYITKLLLVFGHSDFATRFFPALFGTATVFFLYRLGLRLLTREASLLATALMACSVLHIQISRTVRPHPYIVCLATLSLAWLLDFLRQPCRRTLLKVTGLNFLLLIFHFNTLLIVGAQIALVIVYLYGVRKTPAMLWYRRFLYVSVASLSLELPMLFYRMGKFPGFNMNKSMLWTFERSLANLSRLLQIFPWEASTAAGWIVFCLGLVLLFAYQRQTCIVLANCIFLPIIALILAKYGIFYEPWHIAFIIPGILLVCAHALAWMLRPRPLAQLASLAIALVCAFVIVHDKHDDLYAQGSSIFMHDECYKTIATNLPSNVNKPGAVIFNNVADFSFVNWYNRQFSALDLAATALTPDDAAMDLTLVATGPIYTDADNTQGVARLAEQLLADFGPNRQDKDLTCATIRYWNAPRTPGIRLDSSPSKKVFSAYAPEFLKKVWKSQDVQIYLSPLANHVYPSAFDHPGSFTARYASDTPIPAGDLALDLDYTLDGQGNTLAATCSFDDGAAQPLFVTHDPTGPTSKRYIIRAPKAFYAVDVAVTMVTSSRSPSFYNVSDAVHFEQMALSVLPPLPEAFQSDVPVAGQAISPVEDAPEGRYRWGLGPETTLRFMTAKPGTVRLLLGLNNPIAGQTMTILINGAPAQRLDNLPAQPWLKETRELTLDLDARAGENTITLGYDLWNAPNPSAPQAHFAPGDGRSLAMAFTRLGLLVPPAMRAQLVEVAP
ncbi:MAG: glycosyltransferase family 39 protein [Acidobacteriota bacterium]